MSQPPEPVDTFSLLRSRADDPPNIRALRVVVLGMGALLVLGFGAVIARIVYLTTRQPVSSEGASPLIAPQPKTKSGLDTTLALPQGAKIQSQSLSGTRLSVHYVTDAEETIVIVDLETGQVVGQVRINSAKK
ncbi:MAG: DUF6476 family protein [Hyphomicrobiaceae bacterium]